LSKIFYFSNEIVRHRFERAPIIPHYFRKRGSADFPRSHAVEATFDPRN